MQTFMKTKINRKFEFNGGRKPIRTNKHQSKANGGEIKVPDYPTTTDNNR